MRRLYLLCAFGVVIAACEREVTVENPYPPKARFCHMSDTLSGRWQSDSVWVITRIDSLDTTITDTRPTVFYDMDARCGADTLFRLQYTNYSGVTTREFHSHNFATHDSAILLYGELDFDRDAPSYEIHYHVTSDTTLTLSYKQNLNSGQHTETWVWLKLL